MIARRVSLSALPAGLSLALLFAAAWSLPEQLVRGEHWPCFRGPSHQGVSADSELPTQWTETKNVLWKGEIPGEGHSSPIVWGDHVFVTTAAEEGKSLRLLCWEASSGKLRWDRELFRQTPKRKEGRNTYATPTPVTDGKQVYCVFGDGSICAVDFDGKIVWQNREFPYYSRHGLGASPLLWNGRLILSRDGSKEAEGDDEKIGWQVPWDQGFVLALNTADGSVAWKTGRQSSRIGHVSPNLWQSPDGQMWVVSGTGDVVQFFAADTGELGWTSENTGEGVVPSIVVGNGMVYSASGWGGKETTRAFSVTGKGNQVEATMAWELKRGMPRISSYVYGNGVLLWGNENGAMCVNATTGQEHWQKRLDGPFNASPLVVGKVVYLTNEGGTTFLLKLDPEFEVLETNPLGEEIHASAAASNGRLYFRSVKHLICVGEK